MKWGTISLITFLMAFPFGLKGVASSSVEVHGILGDTVLLPAPEFTGTPFRIQWLNVTSGKSTLILRKQWNTPSEDSEKYNILNNGSLTIDNLVKEDAGNYKVDGHNKSGAALFKETTVTLKVHDRLPQPLLIENCSDKSLICQVEPSSSQKLKVTLFQNNKLKINQEPNHANGTWRWTFQQSSLVGKFKCEIASDHIKNQNEKEINCLGPASQQFRLIYIIMIGGGVVIIIICMALIVYCVRRKRAERHEIEDQEKELQAWIANDDLKHRKLPQPPVHAVPNQAPQQQQRLPLVRSEQHQPGGPPQPCPRPPQRKPPRRMKEGP
ncbi:T-cell surface antigen CD2-like isoform X1 [Sceloporus undulatus]|uniref:T-cell surface antigen CD2-like isoform X1 n=1 Tax=Sceloporus undulatus TaxID=8520 RepID=UPI001C4DC374|nr:T-cell surface antigen CD2-like isoform X1 [Sceloporus undulatus]